MQPGGGEWDAVEAARRARLLEQGRERERALRRALEQGFRDQRDARVDHGGTGVAGDAADGIEAKIVAAAKAGGVARVDAEEDDRG